MKLITLISLTLFVSACGSEGSNGLNGNPGQDGRVGDPGLNSLVTVTRTNNIDPIVCVTGNGVVVQSGLDINNDLTLSVNEVQSIGVVCDGAVGPAGPQGNQGDPGVPASVPQYSVTSLIDPCGDDPYAYDEVFLRLANNSILVLFAANASGDNPRLSLLTPGSYTTTDGTSCNVNVDANFILTDSSGNTFYPN